MSTDATTGVSSGIEIKTDGITAEERYFLASQWQLMWRKFKRHRLAVVSISLLGILYILAITYQFWVPYGRLTKHEDFLSASPTRIHLFDSEGRFPRPLCIQAGGRNRL